MHADQLKKLGFDLAYLSLLTKAGVKPLSRWEKEFAPGTEEILHSLGLRTRTVRRSVRSGKEVLELLFSRSARCLDLYTTRFEGTAIDRSAANMRIEGLLFGYPSCCVESFATKGYVKNSLRKADQRILFHWACPSCPITPLLLPYYREAYGECRKAMRGRVVSAMAAVREVVIAENLRKAVATAASLIALSALPTPEAKYKPGDPHWIELEAWEDPDADFLKTDEEVLLHMDPDVQDEDGNLIADGVDLALALSAAIDALPQDPDCEHIPPPGCVTPYVINNMAFGLEACAACGEMVNMGVMEIVNPLENQSIGIPYIAKHYMEHGSFSYAGSVHAGRVNVALLKTVVESVGLAHFIPEPAGTDDDLDGLRNWEEPVFGTVSGNPDTDGDQILDGIDLARSLRAQLDSLPRQEMKDEPYIIEHPMDGIEVCPHCGEDVVMDIWDVINPVTGASISISSMALHFMEHGGFGWEGGQLQAGQGRVDPRQIKAVLTGEGDGHWLYVSPDEDGDYLSDGEEYDLRKNPSDPDEDGDGVLDGVGLAKDAAAEIAALPDKPSAEYVYRLDFELKGLEWCDICGQNVNMGHLTVVNPAAQLYANVPYIAHHYMEHGSFSYAGNVHGEGRLDVKLLVEALHSSGPGHVLSVQSDTDGDGLSDLEEGYFNTDKEVPDTNTDGVPDGFGVAHDLWEAVGELPWFIEPEDGLKDRPFVVQHMLRGLTTCGICGETVNMGWIEVVNPMENIHLAIPYIGLHYMRRGSLSYGGQAPGEAQAGRVNPCLLDIALKGDGTSHLVVLPEDKDGDGLFDDEEAHFGCMPGVADSDGDGVMDGVGIARRMHRQIQELPTEENAARTYVIHYEADCYTHCSICEEEVNCGHVEVTNPLTGLSIRISYIELHFMEFGSLAASREERVDPILLDTILRPGVVIAGGENGATLRWRGAPGKTYQVFVASDPSGPWDAGPVFAGDGAEIVYDDNGPPASQRRFYKILAW
jgi:hypothetical protein